jgi:hypothetical protein
MAFPTSPSINDIYVLDTKTYQWDGNVWNRVSRGGITLPPNSISTTMLANNNVTLNKLSTNLKNFLVSITEITSLTTTNVAEHPTNLYFNNSRIISSLSSGYNLSRASNGRLTVAGLTSNSNLQSYLNFSSNIVPSSNTFNLGSLNKRWLDLYHSGNGFYIGNVLLQSLNDGTISIRDKSLSLREVLVVSSNGRIISANTIFSAKPGIANIKVTSNTYAVIQDDLAANSGGFITIHGSNFSSNTKVLIGTNTAAQVTYINPNRINVRLPNLLSGTYNVYVENDGMAVVRPNGIDISGDPVWISPPSGNITVLYENVPFTTTFQANSDSNVAYLLDVGPLPGNLTLNSNGYLAGFGPFVENANTTYNFVISASDNELQNTTRNFSITVNTDRIIWNTPVVANIYLTNNIFYSNIIYANAWSQRPVTFAANSLPNGLTLLSNGYLFGVPIILNTNLYYTNNIVFFANTSSRSNSISHNYTITASNASPYEYLVIAGGGGGGAMFAGSGPTFIFGAGGGGAGGMLTGESFVLQPACLTVTVGAGGPARCWAPAFNGVTGNGPSSCLSSSRLGFSNVIACGGGGGGSGVCHSNPGIGYAFYGPENGGSGGGGMYAYGPWQAGGTGIPGQGNPGNSTAGQAMGPTLPSSVGGGGGGGAGGTGTEASNRTIGGRGGCGCFSTITGANVAYAGGGAGGGRYGSCARLYTDGGGVNSAGTAGTGGGGSGCSGPLPNENFCYNGHAGGSGIVVLSTPNTIPNATVSGGSIYQCCGRTIYCFTTSGYICWA